MLVSWHLEVLSTLLKNSTFANFLHKNGIIEEFFKRWKVMFRINSEKVVLTLGCEKSDFSMSVCKILGWDVS